MTQSLNVPYMSRLEGGGLQPGQMINIKGTRSGENFDVLLLTEQNHESANAPFILSVKGKDQKIIFNDRQNGKLGKEEKIKFSSKDGEAIDVRIRAHDNKFNIYVNLKEVAQFEYRQPLTSISHLYISGNINLQDINWGGKYYPVPYQAGIDGGYAPGKKLIVSGIPEKKIDNFKIDFLTADNQIAFHFNPRFKQKIVMRNAYLDNSWGTEETEGKLPFSNDLAFDITIVNEPYAFQVFVNGNHFCAFAHRKDPNIVKGIKIEGDIELHGVHVK